MNADRWGDILEKIKAKFEIEEQYEEVPEDIPNAKDFVVIAKLPIGRVMLVRRVRPRVLDKLTNYSKRADSDMSVKYVYDEKEMTERLDIYRYDDEQEEWVKAEMAF